VVEAAKAAPAVPVSDPLLPILEMVPLIVATFFTKILNPPLKRVIPELMVRLL
jgi:hypothetical protein